MEKYKKLIAKAQEPLTDKEYLDKFISDMHLFQPHEVCGVKDTKSLIIAATLSCAKTFGFKNINQIEGSTYYDIIGKVPRFDKTNVEIAHQQERSLEQSRASLILLHINEHYVDSSPIKCTRTAIINPMTNNAVGNFTYMTKFKVEFGLKSILDIYGMRFGKHQNIDISGNPSKFELTETEMDVLFCVCLGVNNRKDVANFLTVIYKRTISAETTVHDAFRRLYRKLNCNTPMQLLEFAVYNDLHLQIPKIFLPNGIYPLNTL